ncbi:ATP-binding protein [Pedobacter alpinus]|uniref:histidine kinase n=1 Tax=Pedobacter alpinus TaxID=1590643 RepID=A0ABW5TV98_9SPHI
MILIVDDKAENIYSLKRLLESKGFSVDSALSGEEALKLVLNNNYALIILDVQMPLMDGFEVAETLNGFNKTKGIPIIFLSAVNTNNEFINKGYESGGIDYVVKPFDPQILLLKVNTFIKLYQQTKELQDTQLALKKEIDARNRVQLELKERVDELQNTLEVLPLIAFTANEEGEIEFVNHNWYNYAINEMQFPQTHPDDVNIRDEWKKAIEKGKSLELEVRIKEHKQQQYKYHLLRIIPILDHKKVIKWIGTFTDIEDQKQIEKKKDEFLSITSHELKTPLTSIKAYIQLLSRSLKNHESEQIKGYIEKAQLQVGKLNELIADLLDISKIENGELKLNKKEFDLKHLIDAAIETITQTNDGFSLHIEGNDDSFNIVADENRIEQVLLNYLTNAIKYSPDTKHINISREINGNFVTIKVRDVGIGIPIDKQERVFSKFYRVEESSLKFQGLGIGLYICSEIIKKHNGTYGVKSKSGFGSEFHFTLPIN